jgi:hypothetical protein
MKKNAIFDEQAMLEHQVQDFYLNYKLSASMEVICLEDEAFYALIDTVVSRIKEQHSIREDRWISGQEAMQKLRISSKTTLQKCGMKAKSASASRRKKSSCMTVNPFMPIWNRTPATPFNISRHGRTTTQSRLPEKL